MGSALAPFAAVDYSSLTTGLTSSFETGVSTVLPILGVILAAGLVIKTIKRYVSA